MLTFALLSPVDSSHSSGCVLTIALLSSVDSSHSSEGVLTFALLSSVDRFYSGGVLTFALLSSEGVQVFYELRVASASCELRVRVVS